MMADGSPPDFFRLADGTPAATRLIRHDDGPSLQRGLERLSETSNAYRFLHYRGRFSEADLHYLTHCDFVDHIATILAILDEQGNETDQVGVARCIRSKTEPDLAEVAIVLVDQWQHLGGGSALIGYLARLAWQAGVRRWQAFSFTENVAIHKLLATVATKVSTRPFGHGVVEAIYALHPPLSSI